MYKVWSDGVKNRMGLKLSGLPTDDEMREAADAVLACGRTMRPGFHVINDISESRPLSQNQLIEVRRAVEGLIGMGMSRVVRVVGRSAIVAMQFKREGADPTKFGADVVATREEAEALLDAPKA